jgi:glycerophosphoryl diester phosphodiesterase
MNVRFAVFVSVLGVLSGGPGAFASAMPSLFQTIAHRGASGYAPEHTAVATAMAHAMGAEFIEQDVVFTRDGRALVLHDTTLETTTNVADVYPDRAREDGRFYAIDFTTDELRRLRKGERRNPVTGQAVYPDRYPVDGPDFPLMFLDEAVALIRALDEAAGRRTGLYPELKRPEFHLAEGFDPVPPFMETLRQSGAFAEGAPPCYIQCFHDGTLKRIRREYGPDRILIQLIGHNHWGEGSTDFDRLLTAEGLAEIATYADGIGLPIDRLVDFSGEAPRWKPVRKLARKVGLTIHPYTLRRETLPEGTTFDTLLEFLSGPGGVDGVFTDFPDRRP